MNATTTHPTTLTAEQFFAEVMAHIESASIREHLNSGRNRALILAECGRWAEQGKDPVRCATYLVCLVMGF